MLFKKNYTELVNQALSDLQTHTDVTNISIGGVARSMLEVINKQLSSYYGVLELNQAMGFVSKAEGYFLDLIGALLNVTRNGSQAASQTAVDEVQKFYVTRGTLDDYITDLFIPKDTTVGTSDDVIQYTVSSDTIFSAGATEIYVPIASTDVGSDYNVGVNALIKSDIGVDGVYTTNAKAIVSGSDTESDENYRYRISNAVLAGEKANETAIRLAALSVGGVADVVMRPYSAGIGSYEVLVIPTEGLATDSLLSDVQAAIDKVQAYGIRGTAVRPTVVPVDLEIRVVFIPAVTDVEKTNIKSDVTTATERYIVNIPLGGTFILNELRQRIMDVSPKIKDHTITCYYFREQPCMLGNISIYEDEMFYPNPNSAEAIKVI